MIICFVYLKNYNFYSIKKPLQVVSSDLSKRVTNYLIDYTPPPFDFWRLSENNLLDITVVIVITFNNSIYMYVHIYKLFLSLDFLAKYDQLCETGRLWIVLFWIWIESGLILLSTEMFKIFLKGNFLNN